MAAMPCPSTPSPADAIGGSVPLKSHHSLPCSLRTCCQPPSSDSKGTDSHADTRLHGISAVTEECDDRAQPANEGSIQSACEPPCSPKPARSPSAQRASQHPSRPSNTHRSASLPDIGPDAQPHDLASDSSASRKARLVWSEELHHRFLHAVVVLGLRSAVPKGIMQVMNVSGLTRENVASHLQKYRMFLKRQARLPPSATVDAADWPKMEAAQREHIAATPLRYPLPPVSGASSSSPSQLQPPIVLSSQGAAQTAAPAATTPAAAGGAVTSTLPPMPALDVATTLPAQAFMPHLMPHSALPFGMTLPAPDAQGQAVGLPMPFSMIPAVADGPLLHPPLCRAAAAVAAPPTAPSKPRGCDLPLPCNPSSLMPPTFSPAAVTRTLAGIPQPLPGQAPASPALLQAAATAGAPTFAPQPAAVLNNPFPNHTASQLPPMMLTMSLSAYNAFAAPDLQRIADGNDPVAEGSPAQANSSMSASQRTVQAPQDDATSRPACKQSSHPPRKRSAPGAPGIERCPSRPSSQRLLTWHGGPSPLKRKRALRHGRTGPATASRECPDAGGDLGSKDSALATLALVASKMARS